MSPPKDPYRDKSSVPTMLQRGSHNKKGNETVHSRRSPINRCWVSMRNFLRPGRMYTTSSLNTELHTTAVELSNDSSSGSLNFSSKECQSPQAFLDAIIQPRGYSTVCQDALFHSTHCPSTSSALQEASYGTHIIETVKNGDAAALRSLLSVGLSPNPTSSRNGEESLLTMVCQSGNVDLLSVMLDAGCNLQVTDKHTGRTPLHDCCRSRHVVARNNLAVLDLLLANGSVNLLYVKDAQGALPLSYVSKKDWRAWVEYIEAKKDIYWPSLSCAARDVPIVEQPAMVSSTDASSVHRNVASVPPCITLEVARLVAYGRMTPHEAALLYDNGHDDDTSTGSDDHDSEGRQENPYQDSCSTTFTMTGIADELDDILHGLEPRSEK